MSELTSILVEIHPRNESRMNQIFSWKNTNLIKPKILANLYFAPTITKSLKTNNYNCNYYNTLSLTNCYDSYYMHKLKCSFPWLESGVSYFGKLPKCGSKDYIYDLLDLIRNVTRQDLNT